MRTALPLDEFFPIADALQGRSIIDIYGLCELGSERYESVHLTLDKGWCRLTVDVDSDEIHASVGRDAEVSLPRADAGLVVDRTRLSALVGREIGWTWTCYNSQGYRDTILMAVPGVVPNVVFHSIASAILVCVTSLEVN
jgi:Family of unknown function (DUF6334)